MEVARLTHPLGVHVRVIMRALPCLLDSAELVVAIVAHAFGVVLTVGVCTGHHLSDLP
jgi:hypothetical protein